jgi:RsmE family RNA methyltransferase
MNLLLVEAAELDAWRRVRLAGRRGRHLVRVLGVAPGRRLRAGVVGGGIGEAEVLAVVGEEVELAVDDCAGAPLAPPLADLVLALPRPKALRRVLRLAATLGVGRLDLVNAWRVERSFFASAVLAPEAIRRELLLGAEQGVTSRLPEVRVHRFLMPYLDALGAQLAAAPTRPLWLAHPSASEGLWHDGGLAAAGPPVLAIGPEGGWIEKEVASFRQLGFRPASLGPWVLATETAVAVALGQLALLAAGGSVGTRSSR